MHHIIRFVTPRGSRVRLILGAMLVPLLVLPADTPLAPHTSFAQTSGPLAQDAAELWRRGQSALAAAQWDEAITAFSTLVRLYPRHADAMVALGYCTFKKGDVDRAERYYRDALAINNGHAGADYGLGQIAMGRKQWDTAATLFREVLRLAPTYEPVRARHNLALSLFAQARYDDAAQVYQEALSQSAAGHYPELYVNAVDNELARANYAEAARWSESGAARYPQNAWLWDKLGLAYWMTHDRGHALEAYSRAEALVYKDAAPNHRTVLSLPFHGRWRVTQGNGGNGDDNFRGTHRGLGARFAWDFMAVDENGRTRTAYSWSNSDYYTFGREVLAPADGRVVALQDGAPDNEPYHRDASPVSGNYVLIEHAPGELSSLAHLENGSIEVKVGQTVRRGQRIARCGNSGDASLPHLHYSFIVLYHGARISWPAQFAHYSVEREGQRTPVERGVPQAGTLVEDAPGDKPPADKQ